MAGNHEHGDNEDNLIPPGFRFKPSDEDMMAYLTDKLKDSSQFFPHIQEVDIYSYSPMELSARYKVVGESSECNFLTRRKRKYLNGYRPDRCTKNGYWKLTSSGNEIIASNGRKIGFVGTLKYYQLEKNKSDQPTQWLMKEYSPDKLKDTFIEWVAVKIYRTGGKSNKNKAVMEVEPPLDSGKAVIEVENNSKVQEIEQPLDFGSSESRLSSIQEAQPTAQSALKDLAPMSMYPRCGEVNIDFNREVNEAVLPELEEVFGADGQLSADQTCLNKDDMSWMNSLLDYSDPWDIVSADEAEFWRLWPLADP